MNYWLAGRVTATLLTVQLLSVERFVCGAKRGISMNNGSELLDRQAYCHIAVWLKYFVVVSLKNDSLVLSGVPVCTHLKTKMPKGVICNPGVLSWPNLLT